MGGEIHRGDKDQGERWGGMIFREKTSGMVKRVIKRCRSEEMDYIL